MPRTHPAGLVREINARYGTDFRLGVRFHGGEQGAYALRNAEGQRFVLKWSAEPAMVERAADARAATDVLRPLSYPVPQYLFSGSTPSGSSIVLTALPGTPCATLSIGLLPCLLELNGTQRGQAIANGSDWPGRMIGSVMQGCDGFCVLESLRTYSPETAQLLVALQAIVAKYRDELPKGHDIAHMDFTPANILQISGTISGVIDWEGVCAGDAAFDLATLLFYDYDHPDVRDELWRAVREHCMPGAAAVYLAHLILRQVDWSIRHHTAWAVAYYLRRACHILCDIGQNGIV